MKGQPKLMLQKDSAANYVSGSGTRTLVFRASAGDGQPVRFAPNEGTIVSTEAGAALRVANLALPGSAGP